MERVDSIFSLYDSQAINELAIEQMVAGLSDNIAMTVKLYETAGVNEQTVDPAMTMSDNDAQELWATIEAELMNGRVDLNSIKAKVSPSYGDIAARSSSERVLESRLVTIEKIDANLEAPNNSTAIAFFIAVVDSRQRSIGLPNLSIGFIAPESYPDSRFSEEVPGSMRLFRMGIIENGKYEKGFSALGVEQGRKAAAEFARAVERLTDKSIPSTEANRGASKRESTSIDTLSDHLSARTYNSIRKAGVLTVEELTTNWPESRLLAITNIGAVSVGEVVEALGDRGLELPPEAVEAS